MPGAMPVVPRGYACYAQGLCLPCPGALPAVPRDSACRAQGLCLPCPGALPAMPRDSACHVQRICLLCSGGSASEGVPSREMSGAHSLEIDSKPLPGGISRDPGILKAD